MRQLEPFSYFADYASAVSGFGGSEPAPDNRYCLHTQYQPLRPGRAAFRLTIKGAKATKGELSLRVHAYKPSSSGEVMLAGGGRIRLDELDSDAIDQTIRIAAAPGVHYALYGYFSEPTDLVAESVTVAIEELESADDGDGVQETRRSALADAASAIDRSNKLCTGDSPSITLKHPKIWQLDRAVFRDLQRENLSGCHRTFVHASGWKRASEKRNANLEDADGQGVANPDRVGTNGLTNSRERFKLQHTYDIAIWRCDCGDGVYVDKFKIETLIQLLCAVHYFLGSRCARGERRTARQQQRRHDCEDRCQLARPPKGLRASD